MLLRIQDIRTLIQTVGIKPFFKTLVEYLEEDFRNWQEFDKSSRYAAYVENGVVELMPTCSKSFFSFKYVNGHPNNPKHNLLNIVGLGMLADVKTGYPLLISEMTLLTALRTAAVSALGSKLMARKDSKKLTIIGCGAQSEFQVLAHHALFDLTEVTYFDLDAKAMDRFAKHLENESFKLVRGTDAQSAIQNADIIITATAARAKNQVLLNEWLKPGQHVSAVGGDSPGKTELDPTILERNKVMVEYFPQTHHEGEIQNLGERAKDFVFAEVWEVCCGQKQARDNNTEITVFDAVGFATEDYSILRYVYTLAKEHHVGLDVDLIPTGIKDPKNLFGLLVDA